MSINMGGFSGGNALLAFAAMQQGRMNEELSESMRAADTRSQMAKDIASIKAHWEGTNRDYVPGDQGHVKPESFMALDAEIDAFMDKYGDDPACADMVGALGELRGSVKLHLEEWRAGAYGGTPTQIAKYSDADVQGMSEKIQKSLDASGTNEQLSMIHIRQLNDDINNSSGMVSGILESRQNATASIISNIA